MQVRGRLILAVAALLLAPPAAAAASGLGAPPPLALAVAVAVGGLGIRWAGRASKTTLEMSRAGFAGWLLLAALALAQDGRVSWFMADGTRLTNAAVPNPFIIVHQCLSGYTEAVRRALEGRENIYDEANNKMPDGGPRYIVRRDGATESYNESRLKALFAGGQIPRVEVVHVDEYEYPPPFLLLPYTVGAPVGQDYFRIRPLWFGLQALLLWVAFLISVRSAGPEASTRAFAWLPAVWFMPPTLVGLQYGNFQTGAIALSVIAMAALASRRNVAAGTLLGFATLGKVFPGVLVVALVARRRWHAVLMTVLAAVTFTALTLVVFGRKPFDDFLFYQLPAIANGSAFGFNNRPEWIPTNYGVYALVAKLRLLGVAGMTQDTGNVVASVYGILLLVLVVVLLVRAPENSGESIVESPLVWLALLNLPAVRSPYVGDGYGQVGTLWLLVLTASRQRRTRAQLWVLSLALVLWGVTLEGFASARPPAWMIVFSIVTQLGLIAFNVAVLHSAARASAVDGKR